MTKVTEAIKIDEFEQYVPDDCPKSRRKSVAYFLAELSQITTLPGVIERVEKSLRYYREKTPRKLQQYAEIHRSAISAWGKAQGVQTWAYPLWDLSNEAIRTELLSQLDAIAKTQLEPKATIAPAIIPAELAELSFEQLQGKRSKGASFAKLEKTVASIKAINAELPQAEKWAINSSVLRKLGGTRPTLVSEFLKGNAEIASYNESQGLGFHQNKGRDVAELAALLEKPVAA